MQHRNNTILLTGANGFLGRYIAAVLTQNGYPVISLGKNSSNDVKADLSNTVPVINDNVNWVIHAAGKAHTVPGNSRESKLFFDVNFEGTKNLCRALDRLPKPPSAFVFISSVAVYGVDEGLLIDESAPLIGSTDYALSKIEAENWLKGWANKNSITLTILRLPLIAGKNPPGNLGAMINGIKTNRYFSIGTANAKKSIVWVEDVATVIPLLANVGGTYNLTDGYHPSFGEIENVIAGALNKKLPLKIPISAAKLLAFFGNLMGSRAPINKNKLKKITSNLTFDDSKVRNKLNWKSSDVLLKLRQVL